MYNRLDEVSAITLESRCEVRVGFALRTDGAIVGLPFEAAVGPRAAGRALGPRSGPYARETTLLAS